MRDGYGRILAATVLLAVLTGCGDGATSEAQVSTPSGSLSLTPGAASSPFPNSSEPVAVEAGTYRMPTSSSSVADFTVAFPDGWAVQYGDNFSTHPGSPEEVGFYAALPEAIYADACKGSDGQMVEVGPGVDDLATALLRQPGPEASEPVATMLGGYPATRIDLTVPNGFSLKTCSLPDGLQIWLVPPDDYTVLLADGKASVYIVEVDGQRQVFVTQHRPATSNEDLRELKAVLDSIHIKP